MFRKIWKESCDWIVTISVAVIVTLLLRLFVFNINVVEGTSMCTTLYSGDVLVCRKVGLDHIHRGGIVTAIHPEVDEFIVKRVIGLPGETVTLGADGIFYIDGVRLDDEYQSVTVDCEYPYDSVTLGDDEFFIVGDNRLASYDSRYFGPVARSAIRDVVVFRFYPPTLY